MQISIWQTVPDEILRSATSLSEIAHRTAALGIKWQRFYYIFNSMRVYLSSRIEILNMIHSNMNLISRLCSFIT